MFVKEFFKVLLSDMTKDIAQLFWLQVQHSSGKLEGMEQNCVGQMLVGRWKSEIPQDFPSLSLE